MKNNIILQQSEWHIMQLLWEESPRTITNIFHILSKEIGWSKSTVNTMLSRMVEKKIIHYKEGVKAKQYYPNVLREDVAFAETKSLLERVYQGSVGMMMSTMVGKKALTKEEIEELYTILDQMEGK